MFGFSVEEHEASYLLVYSLATHEVIKKLDFSGAIVSSFQASSSFLVVVCPFTYFREQSSINARDRALLHLRHCIYFVLGLSTFYTPYNLAN